PVTTSFSPVAAYWRQSVTLNGTNFSGATRVLFNETSAMFTNAPTTNADLRITAVIPDAASTGPITVETPHGNFTTTSNFTVLALPRIAIRSLPGTNLVELRWLAGFSLQRADSLQPGATWTGASIVSTGVSNGVRTATVSLVPSNRFFRVFKP